MEKLRIGVVGYCPPSRFDEVLAAQMLQYALQAARRYYQPTSIKLVSGLTNVGVPAIAYAIARQNGWETAGVACEKAHEFDCFPVDEVVIVGKNWGDETPAFVNRIDVIIRIGGGDQSLREVAEHRKIGGRSYAYDLPRLDG